MIPILIILSLLQPQIVQAETNNIPDRELLSIVDDFIPPFHEFVTPEKPSGTGAIRQYDFDKDGQNELVVTLKEVGGSKLKAMLLKEVGGRWSKVWEVKGEGYGVHFSGFRDITGDGKKEYLIGWAVGASAGNQLEIFTWNNNILKKMANGITYHKIEFLMQNHQVSIAVWERYCCDTYIVNLLKWEEGKLVQDEEMYKQYYPKIRDFYDKKINKMDAWFYWYSLADAQIKADLLQEAKESIHKGLSFNLETQEFVKLQEIIKRMEQYN